MSGPAYRIRTPRLLLRCWSPSDAPLLSESLERNLEHLRPWFPWAHEEPKPLAERVRLLRLARASFDLDEDFIYGIFNPEETEVLGSTWLRRRGAQEHVLEMGYWIDAVHTGQGLATEVASALTQVASRLHEVERLEIRCAPTNRASAAVPKRLGYTLEATLRRQGRSVDGKPRDTQLWALVGEEFEASPAARLPLEAWDAAGLPLLGSREALPLDLPRPLVAEPLPALALVG